MTINDKHSLRLREGKDKFEDALLDSALQTIFRALVPGKLRQLWNFDQVKERLHLTSHRPAPGIQQVDLDKIVGSVGRADEFGPTFLPRDPHMSDRWSSVYAAAVGTQELPPVELYQVGDAYFVVDGNHRVSIARLRGQATIDAEVTVWDSPVEMTPDMRRNTFEVLAASATEAFEDLFEEKATAGADPAEEGAS
ncbi:MAG: hypothetical protein IPK19_20915 [Chloroflexi bacterium]|nr:hypothetical protein [Chloroflexota bacterium]